MRGKLTPSFPPSAVGIPKGYTVKKVTDFPVKLFPAVASLVSDIPPGDGKIGNILFQCNSIVLGNLRSEKNSRL